MSSSVAGDAQRLHQLPGVGLRHVAGREARHGESRGCSSAADRAGPSRERRRSARGSSRDRRTPRSPPCRWRSPAAAGPVRRPGCCRPRSSPGRAVPGRPERTGSARPRAAGRDRRRGDRGRTRSCGSARPAVATRRLSSKVPCRARSCRSRSRSMSAMVSCGSSSNRAPWPSRLPFSKMLVCPSQDRSVVDSPWPGRGVEVGRQATHGLASGRARCGCRRGRW